MISACIPTSLASLLYSSLMYAVVYSALQRLTHQNQHVKPACPHPNFQLPSAPPLSFHGLFHCSKWESHVSQFLSLKPLESSLDSSQPLRTHGSSVFTEHRKSATSHHLCCYAATFTWTIAMALYLVSLHSNQSCPFKMYTRIIIAPNLPRYFHLSLMVAT